MVNIEIDGKPLEVRDGAMIIEAADKAAIKIPRFCYHKKLSIAANCRMCLVEVEKMRKPMPACATPVSEGMKVFTRSPAALAAQKGTMEFLLINHPLDCPICDQGGECELQDVAVGYGRDVSRYAEHKRVVANPNLGPLISTDMTRCIHCTRCVRFGDEVAGIRELGATGRGDHTTIGTFVSHTVSSELSGNVIDLCPVGALTSKPFRFGARAWELTQFPGVAPHDALGSNTYLHVHRGKVVRVVPRENEALNETWLSDRDRFSYEGIYHETRLQQPKIKRDGEWQTTDWDTALQVAAEGLKKAGADMGALGSAAQSVEELYLLQKIARGLGSNSVDHRLRQTDTSDQQAAPLFPYLGQAPANFSSADAVLLVGSNIRKEQPLLSQRIRKAVNGGAKVSAINAVDFDFNFAVANKWVVSPQQMVTELAAVAKASHSAKGGEIPAAIAKLVENATAGDAHKSVAEQLASGETAAILLGNLAHAHPAFAQLRSLSAYIAQITGSSLGYLPQAANSAGAWLAGAVPHRGVGGQSIGESGLDANTMLTTQRKAYLLLGIEPGLDFDNSAQAMRALGGADSTVALTAYETPCLLANADVLLPIAGYGESSGTLVNGNGDWQSYAGAVKPLGDSRPAWKVLRVLGNLLNLMDFEYNDSAAVLAAVKTACGDVTGDNSYSFPALSGGAENVELVRVGEVPIYATDMLVRRAGSLQNTPDAKANLIRLNAATAQRLGLQQDATARVAQGENAVTLPVAIDDRIADGCVWVASGVVETAGLGASFGAIQVELS